MSRATRFAGAVLLVLFFTFIPSGCSISERQEIEMGRKLYPEFEREFGGLYPDAAVQQYVNSVGMTMARHAGRPNLDWQFAVVNSDQVNAFAVPGGYIYLTRGLLFRLNNEAQLAGVLGHEAGHIQGRHSVKQLERARTAQGATAVVGVVGAIFGFGYAGDIAGLASGLALMKYSRGQEEQADYSGLNYMTAAGYNPGGIVQTMEILQSAAGRGGGTPAFLASHPNPGNRIEYLTKAIRDKHATAAQAGEYGQANFQQAVLARRPREMSWLLIEPDDPGQWCGVCRAGPRQRTLVSEAATRDAPGARTVSSRGER